MMDIYQKQTNDTEELRTIDQIAMQIVLDSIVDDLDYIVENLPDIINQYKLQYTDAYVILPKILKIYTDFQNALDKQIENEKKRINN